MEAAIRAAKAAFVIILLFWVTTLLAQQASQLPTPMQYPKPKTQDLSLHRTGGR